MIDWLGYTDDPLGFVAFLSLIFLTFFAGLVVLASAKADRGWLPIGLVILAVGLLNFALLPFFNAYYVFSEILIVYVIFAFLTVLAIVRFGQNGWRSQAYILTAHMTVNLLTYMDMGFYANSFTDVIYRNYEYLIVGLNLLQAHQMREGIYGGVQRLFATNRLSHSGIIPVGSRSFLDREQ